MSADSSQAALRSWLGQRALIWQEKELNFSKLREQTHPSTQAITQLALDYRLLAKDLALAQQTLAGSRVTLHLERLVFELDEYLHQPVRRPGIQLRTYLCRDIPAVLSKIRMRILATTSWFMLTGLAGWFAVTLEPELIGLFASESMINEVQNGRLWTDDLLNVVPSSVLSAQIATNNIVVTLTAFVLGCFYGLGTLYIIGLNGLMLGGVFAYTALFDLDQRLLEFIVAHGFVELSIICLAGAAGIQLGEALINPGTLSRLMAFQRAVADTSKVLFACAFFLIGAGVIEGHVSPSDQSFNTKLLVGLTYWLLFLVYCSGYLCRALRLTPVDSHRV